MGTMEGDGGRGGERGTGLEQEERWIAKVFFLPSTGLGCTRGTGAVTHCC